MARLDPQVLLIRLSRLAGRTVTREQPFLFRTVQCGMGMLMAVM